MAGDIPAVGAAPVIAAPVIAAPGTAAPGRTLSPEKLESIRKSAQDFESMAVAQLLQPMFRTVDTSKGMFGGGKGEAAWKPMMVDEMAKMLTKNGGIGIADSVMKEMLRIQEAKDGGG